MDIDYKHYMVYPFTVFQLKKKYTKDVLDKYFDQLAFLYQNGFDLDGNQSLEQVEEQLWLFNYLKTYDDFEELKNTTVELDEPSPIGYKIVDSALELVLKGSAWAIKKIHDIKTLGDMYSENMKKYCDILKITIDSDDLEIKKVVKEIFDDRTLEIFDECLENIELELYNVLLIKYQELYSRLIKVHQKIVKKLGNSVTKGELARVGNINDELYGSAGGYNPQNDEMKFFKGSAIFELKKLCDDNNSDDDLSLDLLLLCKECIGNGDRNTLFMDFVKGKKGIISKVRKALKDVCFNGIMVLLCLKHNLSLDENDNQNSERAKKIMHELKAVCDTCGYYFSEVA